MGVIQLKSSGFAQPVVEIALSIVNSNASEGFGPPPFPVPLSSPALVPAVPLPGSESFGSQACREKSCLEHGSKIVPRNLSKRVCQWFKVCAEMRSLSLTNGALERRSKSRTISAAQRQSHRPSSLSVSPVAFNGCLNLFALRYGIPKALTT